jgi:solute carrier family 35 (UDP-sugar transporter), member A1/2/3
MCVFLLCAHQKKLLQTGVFAGWTRSTWIPVLSSAVGGVIVGQVTKHAGSVKKGFALIGGILVTALAQYVAEREVSTIAYYCINFT